MAMRRTTLLLALLVVISLGLVHAEEAREASIVMAAEASEEDKHNPLFKVSELGLSPGARESGKKSGSNHGELGRR